ncbi:MAG: tol-pal system protein YbgF [Hyphomicrobiaceae bacterium]
MGTKWRSRNRGGWVLALLVCAAAGVSVGVAALPAGAQGRGAASETEQLRARVEQLEGQLIDLQVLVGTLESLARSPTPARSSSSFEGAGGSEAQRISMLETQVRALSAQIEQMSSAQRTTQGTVVGPPAGDDQRSFVVPGFGQTTVVPSGDPIGGLLRGQESTNSIARSPQADYERAYGALLQQNYDAAEAQFLSFLEAFPRHELAGIAQYWLGEIYLVRKDYAAAEIAFVRAYRTYPTSTKAADSMLGHAIALGQMRQTVAACGALERLDQQFPDAPAHVRRRAADERVQLRCG